METRMAGADTQPTPASGPCCGCAIGLAYIDFAVHEPGWFQLAFHTHEQFADSTDPAAGGHAGAPPFQLLVTALDDLVTTGVLRPSRARTPSGPARPPSMACPTSPPGAPARSRPRSRRPSGLLGHRPRHHRRHRRRHQRQNPNPEPRRHHTAAIRITELHIRPSGCTTAMAVREPQSGHLDQL